MCKTRCIIKKCVFLVFLLECFVKILGLGFRQYLKSGWNVFDLITSTLMPLAAICLNIFPEAVFFVAFRPLRMLRLFKIKKRYRDVFGTLVILFPLMCSTVVVMLVLYYFYAIIGMELFAGYDLRNCCQYVQFNNEMYLYLNIYLFNIWGL